MPPISALPFVVESVLRTLVGTTSKAIPNIVATRSLDADRFIRIEVKRLCSLPTLGHVNESRAPVFDIRNNS